MLITSDDSLFAHGTRGHVTRGPSSFIKVAFGFIDNHSLKTSTMLSV